MTNNITKANLSKEEQALIDQFLIDNQLFYGPDPEIMLNHGLDPRSDTEERILSAGLDAQKVNMVRGRLTAALDETHTMVEQMGVAPGAKWGEYSNDH